jgi:hypothetical protein
MFAGSFSMARRPAAIKAFMKAGTWQVLMLEILLMGDGGFK